MGVLGRLDEGGGHPTLHPVSLLGSAALSHHSGSCWPGARAGWDVRAAGRRAEAYFSFWFLHTHEGPWVSEHTPGQHPVNLDARSGLPMPSGSWGVSGPSPTSGNQEGRKAGLSPPTRTWGTGTPWPRMTVPLNLSPRCQNLPITSILRTLYLFGGKDTHTHTHTRTHTHAHTRTHTVILCRQAPMKRVKSAW